MESRMGCHVVSVPHWSSLGSGQIAPPPISYPWASGISVLLCLEHLLPSFASHLGAQRVVSYTFFLTPTAYAPFCPLLIPLLQGHHHLDWWAHLCPVVGSLELAGTGGVHHGAALGSPTAASTLVPTPNGAINNPVFGCKNISRPMFTGS